MKSRLILTGSVLFVLTAAGAATGEGTPPLLLTSSAFARGGAIPPAYTCEGRNVSPPLAWSDAPAGTKTFALVVEDPDVPDPKGANTNIRPLGPLQPAFHHGISLPEGARAESMPAGARRGA